MYTTSILYFVQENSKGVVLHGRVKRKRNGFQLHLNCSEDSEEATERLQYVAF